MNLEDIKKFLEENKDNEEVKTYLQGFKTTLSVEEVQKFLKENTEGKKWIDSNNDQFFNKSLTTWKEKTLPKVLDDEIKKRFPDKDQKDIELEQIKAELLKIQSEKSRESLTNKAIKVATEKKIPLDLVDYFIAQDLDEQSTLNNLTKFEEAMKPFIQTQVEERLKGNNSYVPPANNQDFKGKNPWRKETRNLTEQARILKESPELAKQLMASSK